MFTLIVEDDFTIRLILQRMLAPFGECHVVVDGEEAVEAFRIALDAGKPYDLVCLDVMMPRMDGQTALKIMREMEEARGVVSVHGSRIVMVSALGDYRSISTAHWNLCDAYPVKPLDRAALLKTLADLHLIPVPPDRAAAARPMTEPSPVACPPARDSEEPAVVSQTVAAPTASDGPKDRTGPAAKRVTKSAAPRRAPARPVRH